MGYKCSKCGIEASEVTEEGMLCGVCRFELNSPLRAKKDDRAEVPCSVGLEGPMAEATKELTDAARGYDEHRDEDMLQELMDAALGYAEAGRQVKAELPRAD